MCWKGVSRIRVDFRIISHLVLELGTRRKMSSYLMKNLGAVGKGLYDLVFDKIATTCMGYTANGIFLSQGLK